MLTRTIPYGPVGQTLEVSRETPDTDIWIHHHFPEDGGRTDSRLVLDNAEAQALLEALEDALDYDPTASAYVQVRYLAGPGRGTGQYTYRDPSGKLAVGDLVRAPHVATTRTSLAEVVEMGRGGFAGAVLDITERLTTEPLSA